jgi:hypothetical protein
MTKTKKRGQPEYNRNFNVGDFVLVDGYGEIIFKVEGYREIREVSPDEDFGYTEYDVSYVDKPEEWWDIAHDEDMKLLAKASDTAKFLRNRQARERRRKHNRRKVMTVDDLLSDLHSYNKLYQSLPDGQMRESIDMLKREVIKQLRKRTSGGAN